MTTNNEFKFGMDDKFEDALAMLAAGVPLDTILAEAGKDAGQLRPLLEMVSEVSSLKQTIPIPPPQASLQKMLAHGEKLAASSPPPVKESAWQIDFLSLFRGGFRLAAGLTTALMLFVLVGGMLSLAAQRSVPGDSLYTLKQARETLQLNLTSDPERREALNKSFNERRRMEIETLLERDREATVDFEENIQTITATTIEINGLTLEITPETEITGQLAVGARVRVEAMTRPPTLVALSITVLEPVSPPTPTMTPTATPQPTVTLPKVQATDTLPKLQPTATVPTAQTNDTINLPATPPATDDNDDENENDGENNNDADFADNENQTENEVDENENDDLNDNQNDDFDDNSSNNSDDFEDDNFDADGNDDFNDNSLDDDNLNDNDADRADDGDHSGRGSGDDDVGSEDNQDDKDGGYDDKDNSGKESSDDD